MTSKNNKIYHMIYLIWYGSLLNGVCIVYRSKKVNWMAEGHLHIYLLYTLQESHKLVVWQHKRKEICFVYQRKLACRVRAGPKELFIAVFAKIEESTWQKRNNFHLQLKAWYYCSIWTFKNHMKQETCIQVAILIQNNLHCNKYPFLHWEYLVLVHVYGNASTDLPEW